MCACVQPTGGGGVGTATKYYYYNLQANNSKHVALGYALSGHSIY